MYHSYRLRNNTSPIITSSTDPYHYFQKGDIIEEKKLDSSDVVAVSLKLPPVAVEMKQAKSAGEDKDDTLLGSGFNINFSPVDEQRNMLESTAVVEESSIGGGSASMTKTHRRSVSFAPSVCVHEHGLEVGDVKLCMPMIFNDRPFCCSGLPVQLSDERMATYHVPSEQMGDRVVLRQSLRDQEVRLITVGGYNRSYVQRRMDEYCSLQQQQGEIALDDVDHAAILFCAKRESDAAYIHSEHIPRMFLQGLYFAPDFVPDIALAEWYRKCQFVFGAGNASTIVHRRAVHLQQSLEAAAGQSNDDEGSETEFSVTTAGRKRSCDFSRDGCLA